MTPLGGDHGIRREPRSGCDSPTAPRQRPEDLELPSVPPRRILGDVSEEAREGARIELLDIIRRRRFSVVFQPVVEVLSGSILGHEALCRGPGGTAFEAADYLFGSSHELHLAHELDSACRETILVGELGLQPGTKLFLNVLPDTLAAGLVSVREILEATQRVGLRPADVVLELSERVPLEHADGLRRRVEPFRDAGFPLAMDDIGAGYWSLRLVPEVQPDYMKIDRSLVSGVHDSVTQQDAVAAIIEMGDRHAAEIICEGIESQDDLDEVIRQRARYAQGFLLAQPRARPVREVAYRRR